MSKMSQAHAELEEQAYEYGFNSLQEALDTGEYEVVYGPYRAYLDKKDGQAEAHEAWLEEKEQVLNQLSMVSDNLPAGGEAQQAIEHAIDFIKKGEI